MYFVLLKNFLSFLFQRYYCIKIKSHFFIVPLKITVISMLFGSIMLSYGAISASKHLHRYLLHIIFGAPQKFFDTIPKGRIISRFSTDINTVDNRLPLNLRQTLTTFFRVGFRITNEKNTSPYSNLYRSISYHLVS